MHLSELRARVPISRDHDRRRPRYFSRVHSLENVTEAHLRDAFASRFGRRARLSALHAHLSSLHAHRQAARAPFLKKVMGPREEFGLRLSIPL
jgi:hypothetical protein